FPRDGLPPHVTVFLPLRPGWVRGDGALFPGSAAVRGPVHLRAEVAVLEGGVHGRVPSVGTHIVDAVAEEGAAGNGPTGRPPMFDCKESLAGCNIEALAHGVSFPTGRG